MTDPEGNRLIERILVEPGVHTFRLTAETVSTNEPPPPWEIAPGPLFSEPVPYSLTGFGLIPTTAPRVARVVAGGEEAGFADGVGAAARFGSLGASLREPDRHLVVADNGNHRLRQVSPDGRVQTIAGSGLAGHQDGPAAEARFDEVVALAGDGAGGVWVLERTAEEERLRHVSAGGEVSTRFRGRVPTGIPEHCSLFQGLPCDRADLYYLLERILPWDSRIWVEGSYRYFSVVVDSWRRFEAPPFRWMIPDRWHFKVTENRRALYLGSNGDLIPLDESRNAPPPGLTNRAGVRFFSQGDRLFRQSPGSFAQTLYRHGRLGPVVWVQDEEVWAIQDAAIVRLEEPAAGTCRLTVRVGGDLGTVTNQPVWYLERGTTHQLIAQPASGAEFGGWSGDATGFNRVLDVLMDGDKTVIATFGYPLRVICHQCQAAFSPELPAYSPETELTITVRPEAGLDQVFWNDGATGLVRRVTVWAPWVVEAFAYRIESAEILSAAAAVPSAPGGDLERRHPTPLHPGAPVWVRAYPATRHRFAGWSDGETAESRWLVAGQGPPVLPRFELLPGLRPGIRLLSVPGARHLRVAVTGNPGEVYRLEFSSDLWSWQELQRFRMPPDGVMEMDLWPNRPHFFLRTLLTVW